MADIYEKLGGRIRKLRKDAGLTQAKVAEMANISDEFLSRVERGIKAPSILTAERVADALGVTIAYLFTFGEGTSDAYDDILERLAALLRTADAADFDLIEKLVRAVVTYRQR